MNRISKWARNEEEQNKKHRTGRTAALAGAWWQEIRFRIDLGRDLGRKIRKSHAKHRGHCIPMAYPGVCRTKKAERSSKTAKPLSLAPSKEHLSPYLTLGFLIDAETSVGETHIVTIHSHSTSMTDTHSHSTSMTDTYTCSWDRKTKVQPFWKRISEWSWEKQDLEAKNKGSRRLSSRDKNQAHSSKRLPLSLLH